MSDEGSGNWGKDLGIALADALTAPTDGLGVGTTSRYDAPTTGVFGTVSEYKDFLRGCHLEEELGDKRTGSVVFETTERIDDTTTKRVVGIGRTPDEFQPGKGGKLLEDAGDPKELLMVIRKTGKPGEDPQTLFRYVGEEEIKGVTLVKGEDGVKLQPVPSKVPGQNKQIQVPGRVDRVSVLRLHDAPVSPKSP